MASLLSDHLFIVSGLAPLPPPILRRHVLQDTISEPCAWRHALPLSVPTGPLSMLSQHVSSLEITCMSVPST